MDTRTRYTRIEDEPTFGSGHVLGAERLDGGLVRVWCACGWRGDEWPGGNPLTHDEKMFMGKAWANHVALSVGIARAVL